MGSGKSDLYSGTRGQRAVPGSIDYMPKGQRFSKYIKNRKDIDLNGYIDVIAHGSTKSIQIQNGNQVIAIDHRTAAKMFKKNPAFKGKSIRLLSCDTGKDPLGFAQNLANKLNVVVEAPTEWVWATPSGHHFVAAPDRYRENPDTTKPGRFIKFYPGGNKRWLKK